MNFDSVSLRNIVGVCLTNTDYSPNPVSQLSQGAVHKLHVTLFQDFLHRIKMFQATI